LAIIDVSGALFIDMKEGSPYKNVG